MVIPTQMTRKAITIVIIWAADALSPWKRTYGGVNVRSDWKVEGV